MSLEITQPSLPFLCASMFLDLVDFGFDHVQPLHHFFPIYFTCKSAHILFPVLAFLFCFVFLSLRMTSYVLLNCILKLQLHN